MFTKEKEKERESWVSKLDQKLIKWEMGPSLEHREAAWAEKREAMKKSRRRARWWDPLSDILISLPLNYPRIVASLDGSRLQERVELVLCSLWRFYPSLGAVDREPARSRLIWAMLIYFGGNGVSTDIGLKIGLLSKIK